MTRLVTVALLLWAGTAHALVDARLARDIVCESETMGKRVPAWSVGDKDPLDWGLCQIRYESAWRYGGFDPLMKRRRVPSRSPGDLFIPEVSRAIALNLIGLCKRFYPRGDAQRIIYCYMAGLWSKPGTMRKKWRKAGKLAAEYQRRNQIRLAAR